MSSTMLHFSENAAGKPSSNDNRSCNSNLPKTVRFDIEDGQIVIPNLKFIDFAELKTATKNFTLDVLGKGSFGRVYKGWVVEKTLVPTKVGHGKPDAIKRWNKEGLKGQKKWQVEVDILGKFSHPNLLKLLGYYHGNNDDEFLLVYEYMQNRSLDNFLFGKVAQPLLWFTRIRIAMDTARALSFLHAVPDDLVIHKNLKTSHILLDEDFIAKLSGFGLSKLNPQCFDTTLFPTHVRTSVYAAPEYISFGVRYQESDVYSFGVVLLEILTGIRLLYIERQSGNKNSVEWAKPLLSKMSSVKMKLMDPRLENNYPPEGAFQLASLISKCLEDEPGDRPLMKEVLVNLEQIYLIKPKVREAREDTFKSLLS